MEDSKSSRLIDKYIEDFPVWSKAICVKLKETIHKADPDIVEDWKWNAPAFSHR